MYFLGTMMSVISRASNRDPAIEIYAGHVDMMLQRNAAHFDANQNPTAS
jgi:hypothetical protein